MLPVSGSTAVNCPTGGTPGQSAEVTGTVMNSGDISLTNVLVAITGGTTLVGPITLAVGETQDFSTTLSVGGSLDVVATGVDACSGTTVTDHDSCGQSAAAPVISDPLIANGNITITWSSIAGLTYRVQSATSLKSPVWTDEPGDVTATGPSCSKTLPKTAGSLSTYYRVLAFHN